MDIPNFYCVVSNRDFIKIKNPQTEEIEKHKIWHFMNPLPTHFLTSLKYIHDDHPLPSSKRLFIDCGAWSYKDEETPSYTPEQCVESYNKYSKKGTLCAAPDHMVMQKHSFEEEERRIKITLTNAKKFIELSKPYNFQPIAVVHGNSLKIRVKMIKELYKYGYDHIALGGLAVRAGNKSFIMDLLKGPSQKMLTSKNEEGLLKLKEEYGLYYHVLGISSIRWARKFAEMGIDSYDGSSMFFSAFTGSTFYELDLQDEGYIKKYNIKDLKDKKKNPVKVIPQCDCKICKIMRKEGYDTREMGSNENNMSRAVHNVNVYMRALKMLEKEFKKK